MSNNALFKASFACASALSRRHVSRAHLAVRSGAPYKSSWAHSRWQSNIAAGVAVSKGAPTDLSKLKLPPLQTKIGQPPSASGAALICVTPNLVRDVFSDHSSPSRHVLQQVFAEASSNQSVQIVTAVVHSIAPSSDLGPVDGLSYLASPDACIKVTAVEKTTGIHGRMKDVAAGFVSSDLSLLSFDLGSITFKAPSALDATQPIAPAAQADMLLASTTFTQGSQGHASVLLREVWKKGNDAGSWTRMQSALCESATVSLHESAPARSQFMSSLLPLTVPRVISAGLGNVISQLAAAPDSAEPAFAASGELERAVSDFFVAREQFPRPVQAWALVLPQELIEDAHWTIGDEIESQWTATHPNPIDMISLILRGARLHKVLSGGGGWGKKAGLLSLDPETSFARSSEPDEEMFRFMAAGADQASMLGEVAKVGDYVQFFIYDDENPHMAADQSTSLEDQKGLRLVLGTADPEGAELSSQDAQQQSPGSGDSWSVKTGQFTALSESGFSLTLTSENAGIIRSKLDVPNSLVSIKAQ